MVSAVIETEEVDHMKEISKESSGNAVFIDLSGRIDSVNVQKVEAEILEQLDGRDNSPVVLRADDLEYISSAGLRVLLQAQKTMNKQGKMVIHNASEDIRQLIDHAIEASWHTCERCGSITGVTTNLEGYRLTLCPECRKEIKPRVITKRKIAIIR